MREMRCQDVASLVWFNDFQSQIEQASAGAIAPSILWAALVELKLERQLHDLAPHCAFVLGADLAEIAGPILASAGAQDRTVHELDVEGRLAAAAGAMPVVVLSFADEENLAQRSIGSLRAAGRQEPTVLAFWRDCLPHLSSAQGAVAALAPLPDQKPQLTYCLFSGGRTGSMMLLDLLDSVGVGAPREHFRPPVVLLRALKGAGPPSLISWYKCIRAISTRNGVFGTKLAPNFLLRLWPLLTPREQAYFADELASAKIIYSYREDRVAQAVSMYRAETSAVWEVTSDEGIKDYRSRVAPPPYDFEALAHLFTFCEKFDAAQSALLARIPGETLGVSYEDLRDDTPGTVRRIASFLGVSDAQVSAPKTKHRKTGDEASEELAARFRADFARRVGRKLPLPVGAGF